MKIAIIRSVFGGIDTMKTLPEQTRLFELYHFDENTSPFPLTQLNDRMKAKYFKTQMHRMVDADLYIWIDGKIQIQSGDFIQQCIEQLNGNDLAIMRHLYRSCIYQEADFIYDCISKGNEYLGVRYGNDDLRSEVECYRKENYPKWNGLNDCCIFIRKGNAAMNNLFNDWWDKCLTYSCYDQASIQFLTWEKGIKIAPLIFKPGTFEDVPHIITK